VLETEEQVIEALAQGSTVQADNTSHAERYHGTQRHFNARKGRKVSSFPE
jgi:hypothetical protein